MQPNLIKSRLLKNIKEDDNGCWIWQRRISNAGYGQMWLTTGFKQGMTTTAHRVSYRVFKGDIPADRQIDQANKELAYAA